MAPKKSNKPAAAKPGNKPGEHHKGRKAPKQPVPVPDRLKRLFNSLCAQIDGGHFSNAIKTCDKILRLSPDDPDALQTKLFLYLQTEQYTPVLELVGLGEKGESGNAHAFEKAYVLYRMQREEQAEEVLKEIKEKNGMTEGQCTLKLNWLLPTAVELYSQLLDTCEPDSEEHADILTNLQAAQQHLDFIESGFLRSLDSLPASLRNNIDTLPPPPQQSTSTVAAAIAASNATASKEPATATPKKKVRMSRVPKGVTPGVTPPPDPRALAEEE
ncbi:hypothetical protein VNI00_013888 [Paramarasmius palmivorus]|uniref:Signal recognition particle subunit SRP72 n=1 Tax=Paramarasmius palmivorus TaxID=297713 RepID=A0AAW0BXV2_9AGAR